MATIVTEQAVSGYKNQADEVEDEADEVEDELSFVHVVAIL
jgi:hypothetical protein